MSDPTTFDRPRPTRRGRAPIEAIAEEFALSQGFLPGDRIEPLIKCLGGSIQYLGDRDTIEAVDGSLIVYGRGSFEVFVSAFTSAETNRLTMAHELGHYVLHSNLGEKQIRAERYGTSPAEWEANWFAAAFLMPRSDFEDTLRRVNCSIDRVAARYMVSPAAAELRLSRLAMAAA